MLMPREGYYKKRTPTMRHVMPPKMFKSIECGFIKLIQFFTCTVKPRESLIVINYLKCHEGEVLQVGRMLNNIKYNTNSTCSS